MARSTLLLLSLTMSELPHQPIGLLPDSYLMERELPPVKLLNLQKVFGSLSEYLERLCHLLSLASSQEKTLATLLLGALWRSAREIRFLLQDVHICKSLNYKFTLSQEN